MNLDEMKLLYLACPYSGTVEEREERTMLATLVAAKLMDRGYNVFSPLTHSHPIAMNLPSKNFEDYDHDFWLKRDFQILENCDALVVLKLPGWEKSYGVKKEIEFAESLNYDILYIDKDLNITSIDKQR